MDINDYRRTSKGILRI